MDRTAEGGSFVVEGGAPITGTVEPAGNKNEALPALAATLLLSGETVLERMPRIRDARSMIELLSRLGVKIGYEGEQAVSLDASDLSDRDPDASLAASIRGSFLIAPGLLHRTGKAILPRPGGDRIGRRRVDTHLLALKALGADVEVTSSEYRLQLKSRFCGTDVFLDEASVMATENAVMAASVADGSTRILNAACEPHVQGLCRLLVAMGARIEGIGTNCLEIHGTDDLHPARHAIAPDHIETHRAPRSRATSMAVRRRASRRSAPSIDRRFGQCLRLVSSTKRAPVSTTGTRSRASSIARVCATRPCRSGANGSR